MARLVEKSTLPKLPRWLLAALTGALFGLAIGGGYRLFQGNASAWAGGAAEGSPATDGLVDIAFHYAEAYQQGNWDYVLEHTLWIHDRLTRVAAQGEGPEAANQARLELMESVSDRSVTGNHLVEGGVADQYVFRPGAHVAVVDSDEGRDDLHVPAARRTWLEVTYPHADNALLDPLGLPLASLRVGVNVSASGHVLKASVYGNVEIDWDSIVYQRAEGALSK